MAESNINFTESELLERVWDKEKIKDIIYRRSYFISANRRREELSNLWVGEPRHLKSASYGNNIGYFVGIDEIHRHCAEYDEILYSRLKPYSDTRQEIDYDKANLGFGGMNIFSCNTPLVFVAENGMTAKLLVAQYGNHAVGAPDGTSEVFMTFGLVFADFVKEGNQWKIWHLIDVHDFSLPAGKDALDLPLRPGAEDDPIVAEYGTPTVSKEVYDTMFGWEYLYFDMPKEYYAYDERYGYGPNSNMGLKYFERPGGTRQ